MLDEQRLGERAFSIDAVHPGDEALGELVESLEPVGFRLQRRSGDGYQLTPPGAEEPVPGVYLFASVPEGTDLEDLHRRLTQAVADWPGAAVWIDLCQALVTEHGSGYHSELERQREVAEAHGM